MLLCVLIALAVGYLLGALPFGYLVARSKGVNIFEVGSKNPGATNVRRVLGSGPGNLVFFLDALKGALATAWPMFDIQWTRDAGALKSLSVGWGTTSMATPVAIAGLIGALVGHSFSCFTHFKGGKGVATASGGLLVLMPLVLIIGAVVWTITFYSSRYVSLASIFAAVSLPISAFLLHQDRLRVGLALLITVVVVVRHRANIERLMNGTENKFVKKKKEGGP